VPQIDIWQIAPARLSIPQKNPNSAQDSESKRFGKPERGNHKPVVRTWRKKVINSEEKEEKKISE